jgi:topoisomerase-4 subunit A
VGDGKAFVVAGTGRAGKAQELKLGNKDLAGFRGSRARRGQQIPAKLKPAAILVPGE